MSSLPLAERFRRLEALLAAHDDLWRPSPFHIRRPDWCERHPALAHAVLALAPAERDALAADNAGLIAWVARFLPDLAELAPLITLPRVPEPSPPATGRAAWHVPGRKQAQVEAFAAALEDVAGPVLEWCSGKGHLGRHLALRHGASVLSLDHDAALCEDGAAQARRAGADQRFLRADALDPASLPHLAARHAVALHACGDLHRALLAGAVAHRATAVDLAPCCYYRTASPRYHPFTATDLSLSRDELHLAVTDTATAGGRDVRLRDQAMAWKLAFLHLRNTATGNAAPRTFKPVPGSWLGLGFAEWCRRLAAREGVPLPSAPDWDALERHGWERQQEVMALSLVRLAFRRPLEVWLALDRGLFLAEASYRVTLREFCPPSLTPRNLLLSAR